MNVSGEDWATVEAATDDVANGSVELLDCPEFGEGAERVVNSFSFVVEGVTQTVVAILGILGNTVASFILSSRKEMRNAFNLLLVTLACFDSTYLFGSVLESFRKEFDMATDVHIHLFPYLLYPFNQMAITGSIFMTVAIALERYIAVHYPLDYSQAMHEANALPKRIFKYASAVTLLSVVFTVTRFFEAKVEYVYSEGTNPGDPQSAADYTLVLQPTAFRTAPIYTMYFNWSRLIVLGIIPFFMLVYLNAKIYQDIKARRKRRFNSRAGSNLLAIPTSAAAAVQLNGAGGGRRRAYISGLFRKKNGDKARIVGDKAKTETVALQDKGRAVPREMETMELNRVGDDAEDFETRDADGAGAGDSRSGQLEAESPLEAAAAAAQPDVQVTAATAAATTVVGQRKPPPPAISVNESRRKKEDNLAVIFMGFILVFLVCHLPRLLLNIHELATIKNALRCQEAGKVGFPIWTSIMISISHFLLVVNSSTNIFIYCFLSSKFREECSKFYQSICRKLCSY